MIADSRVKEAGFDVAVVGGGLSGLLAAVLIARQGRSVVLFEKGKHPGGRAMSTVKEGVHFNLGPRALYCAGHAFRLLKELEIPFTGANPNPGLATAHYQGCEYRLPATLSTLLTSRLLSLREKWKFSRFLKRLASMKTEALARTSIDDWLVDQFGKGALPDLLRAYFRLTTYGSDLRRFSARDALDQLKLALAGNVWYVDGGWQALIDRLRDAAVQHGVTIQSSAHVEHVERTADGIALTISDGPVQRVAAVILTAAPQAVCSMLKLPQDHPLASWTLRQQPVRAACLDVALTKLPRPGHRFALGLDQPFYLSVHSSAARLGPDGIAVIHVMKYLSSGSAPAPGAIEVELEGFLDRVQPGWKSHLLTRRTLPLMTVANSHPEPTDDGLNGRPGVGVEGFPGIYIAGDWVGRRGQLADASAASAEEAAKQLLATYSATRSSELQNV